MLSLLGVRVQRVRLPRLLRLWPSGIGEPSALLTATEDARLVPAPAIAEHVCEPGTVPAAAMGMRGGVPSALLASVVGALLISAVDEGANGPGALTPAAYEGANEPGALTPAADEGANEPGALTPAADEGANGPGALTPAADEDTTEPGALVLAVDKEHADGIGARKPAADGPLGDWSGVLAAGELQGSGSESPSSRWGLLRSRSELLINRCELPCSRPETRVYLHTRVIFCASFNNRDPPDMFMSAKRLIICFEDQASLVL